MQEEKVMPSTTPWYESNLLWGPLALASGIILTLVAAMKHDLRWLLWLAWPCFALPVWWLARRTQEVFIVSVLGIILAGSGLLGLGWWLGEPETPAVESKPNQATDTTETKVAFPKTAKDAQAIVHELVDEFETDHPEGPDATSTEGQDWINSQLSSKKIPLYVMTMTPILSAEKRNAIVVQLEADFDKEHPGVGANSRQGIGWINEKLTEKGIPLSVMGVGLFVRPMIGVASHSTVSGNTLVNGGPIGVYAGGSDNNIVGNTQVNNGTQPSPAAQGGGKNTKP